MSRPPVPADVPPDLYGRNRPDRLMRFLDRAARALVPVLARSTGAVPPPRPAPAPRRFLVSARKEAADDVVALTLTAADGSPLRRWQPGAHIDLCLPSGRVRQYSLCGDPADTGAYRIAVRLIRGGGGGSAEVHDDLALGSSVGVKGPRNAFPFVAEGPVLLVAGGIGITPLLPMAREAARRGLDWHLVHTGRTRSSMPFGHRLADRFPGRVEILPDDEGGVRTATRLLRRAAPGGAVYCCGPTPMLDALREAFEASPAAALHTERFTAPPIRDGRPFTLRLRRSGTTLAVPADRSALDVLRDHDPATPYSCRQGFCGVCTVRVTDGTVDHRDRRPGERTPGALRVCVSRAPEGTCLELDL
ncbi:PDR/VanB family oxidoreductase [Streptomyces sp. C10-9-1]|uniref:PDR/VanB family oxidoreductase n=1 Tax=Streptomyces sp. C10-9-1 TaxID=1859285 RepID=UPI003D728C89